MLWFHLCTQTPSNTEQRGGQRGGGGKGKEGDEGKERGRMLKERMSDNKR